MAEELAGKKPWYKSTGILGPIVTLITMSLQAFGVTVVSAEEVNAIIYGAIEVIGMLVGIYGRATAKETIG